MGQGYEMPMVQGPQGRHPRQVLFIVVGIAGYVIAGTTGVVIGVGGVIGLSLLMHFMTPADHRETFHQFQMRTNEMYRAEQQTLSDRR